MSRFSNQQTVLIRVGSNVIYRLKEGTVMIFESEDADALKHIGMNIGILVAVMLALIVAAVIIG